MIIKLMCMYNISFIITTYRLKHGFSRHTGYNGTVAASALGPAQWATGARHSKSLERRSQRTACSRGEAKIYTDVCISREKLRVVDTKREYVGTYEERLAQQESGAASSNSSTYICFRAAIIQGVH